MAEEREERRRERVETPRGVIIRIDSRAAEEQFFRAMSYQISEDTTIQEIPKEAEEIKSLPQKASLLIHFLTKHYFGSILGGQIISPHMGKDIVLDRIIQFAEMLLTIHQNRLNNLQKKILEKKLRGEDFENELRELLEYLDMSFLVVRELINRQLTAVHVNAPPPLRPPLVNVKLGYDRQE